MSNANGEYPTDHRSLRQMMAQDAIANRRLPPRPPNRKSECREGGQSCAVCLLPMAPQAVGYALEFVEPGVRPATHFLHVPCYAAWESQCSGSEPIHSSGRHDAKAQGNESINGNSRGPGR